MSLIISPVDSDKLLQSPVDSGTTLQKPSGFSQNSYEAQWILANFYQKPGGFSQKPSGFSQMFTKPSGFSQMFILFQAASPKQRTA
jgi:hypothetical protein